MLQRYEAGAIAPTTESLPSSLWIYNVIFISMTNTDYQNFVQKFEPKLTTDDCYTPEYVYSEVISWLGDHVDMSAQEVVRPFYPGGDYEAYPYPDNAIVVDNPPFSILSKIVRYYNSRGIKFFLFAPALTSAGSIRDQRVCNIITGAQIIYHNGAKVSTSFISNLFPHISIWIAGDLCTRIERCQSKTSISRSKHIYPKQVATSATLLKFARHGLTLKIDQNHTQYISKLDAQARYKKGIYGGGYLLSRGATKDIEQLEEQIAQIKVQKEIEMLSESFA